MLAGNGALFSYRTAVRIYESAMERVQTALQSTASYTKPLQIAHVLIGRMAPLVNIACCSLLHHCIIAARV